MASSSFIETDSNHRTVEIPENQIGALNMGNLMVYDLDLGENSSLSLEFIDVLINSNCFLSYHVKPLVHMNYNQSVQSVSSLGLLVQAPLDFEAIDTDVVLNQATGIASKAIYFSVISFFLLPATHCFIFFILFGVSIVVSKRIGFDRKISKHPV